MGASSSKKEKEKQQLKNSNGPRGYKEEAYIKKIPINLTKPQLEKTTFQMGNCVCKIKPDNGKVGTGFFCLIPFPNKLNPLPVLITCNHVLNEQDIIEGSKINFSLDDDKIPKSITINNSRKKFTDYGKDITFIEIKPEDDIKDKSILAIDENMLEDDYKQIYINNKVYMIHYEKGEEVKHSVGEIKYIDEDNYTIKHNCNTLEGSSGGPIINLNNFNVIGVHKGSSTLLNLGTLLKIPIDDFYKLYIDNEMTVNLEDEKHNLYTLICFKTDKFSSLEEKLFKKEPSLQNKNFYYTINNKEINILKTIEENNIINDSTINFYEKISVNLEDEKHNLYSLICFKTDKFSSLEKKLFEKQPSLRNKNFYYTINNNKINILKTIEENNIINDSTINFYEKISVILEDETQKDYSFICFKTDIFLSLEKKLFEKEPSLRNKKLYYTINNKEINILKTIEENNIIDGSTINFKIIEDNNSEVNVRDKEKKINNEKISVIIEDENQNDYSFICKKSDKFTSLEEKLFKKEPSLRNKEHYYIINNKEINISKTIEENNIDDGSTIYYKTRIENNNEIRKENNDQKSEVINQVETPKVNVVNKDKEKRIIGNKISVIIEDENQNAYSLICRTTDKFPSLEKKLFKKFPKLKDYRYYYTINNKNVSFLKTLEENGITDGSTINCYKINDEDIEDEFMVVTIQTTNQDINRPIACKKTDNFKFLEEKLYEKNPDLRNKTLTYLCGGNNLDVKKTLEENKIKNYDVILINIEEEGTTIIK